MAARKKPTASSSSKPGAKRSTAPKPQDPTPVLEWIAAAVGLVVLVLSVGVVASEAFQLDETPASVVVEKLGVTQTPAGYLVEVRASNRGGSPAAQVVVEGELSTSGAEPETAEATFDFIADHSSREGGLFFAGDPSKGELTLRAKGYTAP